MSTKPVVELTFKNTEEGEKTLIEIAEDTDSFNKVEYNTIQSLLTRDVRDEMDRLLSEKEHQIICMRYGLNDGIEQTLLQIAKHFGVTRERIRQIEIRALGKMRNSEHVQNKLKEYVTL